MKCHELFPDPEGSVFVKTFSEKIVIVDVHLDYTVGNLKALLLYEENIRNSELIQWTKVRQW